MTDVVQTQSRDRRAKAASCSSVTCEKTAEGVYKAQIELLIIYELTKSEKKFDKVQRLTKQSLLEAFSR